MLANFAKLLSYVFLKLKEPDLNKTWNNGGMATLLSVVISCINLNNFIDNSIAFYLSVLDSSMMRAL